MIDFGVILLLIIIGLIKINIRKRKHSSKSDISNKLSSKLSNNRSSKWTFYGIFVFFTVFIYMRWFNPYRISIPNALVIPLYAILLILITYIIFKHHMYKDKNDLFNSTNYESSPEKEEDKKEIEKNDYKIRDLEKLYKELYLKENSENAKSKSNE